LDRLTRKDLKTDKFAQEVGNTFEFLAEHRSQVKLYGGIALGLIVLGAGYYFYSNYRASVRRDALAAAIKVDDATVGQPQPPLLNFATQEEKDKARAEAFAKVASQYRGTQEGAIAQLYVAADLADKGKLAEAEKAYQDALSSAPDAYASLASVALAGVYSAQGKTADAEKLLRELIENPTPFVSKDEATIHLAEVLAATKPAEARKLLEPLRTSRSSISRAAITMLGNIPQSN
jgi:predicted negative regulator of RcsB-dependent stress response